MNKKKSFDYLSCALILAYLAGTYLFFINFIFGGSKFLISINHFLLFFTLLFFLSTRRVNVNINLFLIFGSLFSLIILNKIVSSFSFGDILMKSELIYVVFNFSLGFIFADIFSRSGSEERARIIFIYKILIFLVVSYFFYIYIFAEKRSGIFIEYPEGRHDSYQTLSSYLARLLLIGIVVYKIPFNSRAVISWKYIFFVCIVFGCVSLLSMSKKEPVFFFSWALLVCMDGVKKKGVALFLICSFSFFIVNSFDQYFEVYVSGVNRSFASRIDIIENNFSYLFEISGFWGAPYVFDQTARAYPHSFTLSMLISHGIFALLLSWAGTLYVVYHLFKQGMLVLLAVLLSLFALANVATAFDYMVFWFALGLMAQISMRRNVVERVA